MDTTAYEIIASIARYAFVTLLAFILVQIGVRSLIEGRRLRDAKRIASRDVRFIEFTSPDGYAGKWAYIADGTDMGSGADCDIALPESDLLELHAWFVFKRGKVLLRVKRPRMCSINGERAGRETTLSDSDEVEIMDVGFICHRSREKADNGEERDVQH